MAVTDARLTDAEKSILAGMIGKTLDEFIHDEYMANPSTYMSAWLVVDGDVCEIHRETMPLDHFGEKDDVAVTGIRAAKRDDIRSNVVGHKLATERIGRLIEDVRIVEDCQVLNKSDAVAGTHIFTSAIVFALEGTELVIEPDTWFSEEMFVDRGPGASKRLPDAIEDVPKGDRRYATVTREEVSLSEWSEGRA